MYSAKFHVRLWSKTSNPHLLDAAVTGASAFNASFDAPFLVLVFVFPFLRPFIRGGVSLLQCKAPKKLKSASGGVVKAIHIWQQ